MKVNLFVMRLILYNVITEGHYTILTQQILNTDKVLSIFCLVEVQNSKNYFISLFAFHLL